jgi:hypothetical protein
VFAKPKGGVKMNNKKLFACLLSLGVLAPGAVVATAERDAATKSAPEVSQKSPATRAILPEKQKANKAVLKGKGTPGTSGKNAGAPKGKPGDPPWMRPQQTNR